MSDSFPVNRLALQLLQQDQPFNEADYKEYRMKLEHQLRTVERREKLAVRAATLSIVVAFLVFMIGGSGIAGDFDPWSKNATVVSVALGVTYVIAWVVFLLSVATAVSRFRPQVRDLKEQIRDTSLLALHAEIIELRKKVATLLPRDEATSG